MSRGAVKAKAAVIPGFRFTGLSAGIKRSGQKDVGLIFSEVPAVTAALFTTNRIKAAPVLLSAQRLARQKHCRAVIVNSGNANACTGERGLRDARAITAETARRLGIAPGYVCASSTGIIGQPLQAEKIMKTVPDLVRGLSRSSLADVASAIMTTDTFAKASSKKIRIGGKTGTLAGIAKGAGMICPHMATMLCFVFTDIAVTRTTLYRALRHAAGRSFNRLAVDNDMSTNDTVMMMANGLLGNTPLTAASPYYRKFEGALCDVTCDLSRMIAEDGEGATKLIEIIVKRARTESDAEKIGKAVSNSMLVKTAVYGGDPNWGRIMAAAGSPGVHISERKMDIFVDNVKLVSKGLGTGRDRAARKALSKHKVSITIDLRAGEKTAKILTCDLTEGYIRINAQYST